jgi:hypothetical protein
MQLEIFSGIQMKTETKLNSEKWLRKKYEEEKFTIKEIAALLGCSGGPIISRLKKFGVVIRTSSESRVHTPRGSRKYPKLNNQKWLKEQYIDQKKSTIQIAKELGIKTCNSVRQALIRAKTPVRDFSEGQTITNEKDYLKIDEEVLTGCLLGDGSLMKYNKLSGKSFPRFSKKNKYEDHIEFVAKEMFSILWKERISFEVHKKYRTKYYLLRSGVHKYLEPYFQKWYPKENNYKKVVPKDLVITPKVLLHWFLDDGYSTRRKGYGRRCRQIKIALCTECFSKEEQDFLSKQLFDNFGIKSRVGPASWKNSKEVRHSWRIYINQSDADLFFKTIGPPPVQSLAYKWK